MLTKVQKWGNSQGVRFPQRILAEASLAIGDKVNMTVQEGRIVVTPSQRAAAGIGSRILSRGYPRSTNRAKRTGALRWVGRRGNRMAEASEAWPLPQDPGRGRGRRSQVLSTEKEALAKKAGQPAREAIPEARSRAGSGRRQRYALRRRGAALGNLIPRGENLIFTGGNLISRPRDLISRRGNLISRAGNLISTGGNLNSSRRIQKSLRCKSSLPPQQPGTLKAGCLRDARVRPLDYNARMRGQVDPSKIRHLMREIGRLLPPLPDWRERSVFIERQGVLAKVRVR